MDRIKVKQVSALLEKIETLEKQLESIKNAFSIHEITFSTPGGLKKINFIPKGVKEFVIISLQNELQELKSDLEAL